LARTPAVKTMSLLMVLPREMQRDQPAHCTPTRYVKK
jgi:hypothetical protein